MTSYDVKYFQITQSEKPLFCVFNSIILTQIQPNELQLGQIKLNIVYL